MKRIPRLVREQVEAMLKIIDGNLTRVLSGGTGNILSRKTNVGSTIQQHKKRYWGNYTLL